MKPQTFCSLLWLVEKEVVFNLLSFAVIGLKRKAASCWFEKEVFTNNESQDMHIGLKRRSPSVMDRETCMLV